MSKRDLGLDLYAVLGLEPSASADEIRRAVRVFTLKWHPDRNPEGSATARMAEINEARRVLLDPILRAEYDRAYAAGATGRSKSATPRLIPATVDFGRLVPGGPQQHQTVHVFADGGWPSKVQIRPTFGDLWKQTGVEVPEDGDDEVVRLLLSASAPTSHSAGRFVEHTEVVFDDAAVADLTLRFDVPVTAAPSDPRPRPKPPPTGATSAPPTPPSKPKTSPPKPRTPAASPAMGFLARNRTWLWPLGATFIGSLIGGAIAQVDLKHGGAGTDGFVLIIVSILAGGFWSAFARGDGLLAGVVNSFLFWFLVAIPGAGIGVGVGSLLSDGAHSESAVAEAAKVPGVEWVVDAEKFQDAASDDPSSSFYLTPRRLLYVSPDGVTALDRRSGHEIWSWSQGFCVRSCGFSSPGFLGQRAGALWFSDINQTWSVNPSTGRPTKRPDLYLTALGGNVAFDGDFDNSGSLLLLPTLRKLPLDRHAHKVSSGAFQVNKATTIPTGIVLSVLHASSWVGLIGIGPDS